MNNILEIRNLKKYYETQKAVDDISFSIREGSIFGLLGPNGAGKTTLLRMITGILYPDSGEILFDGKAYHPEQDLKYIGYMPEERGLYKKMKIGEQALYLARLKGLSQAKAAEKIRYWFSRLDMESWYNKKTQDLSKGMGQKLQFVTTILHSPKLIILDEPFSGLDPVNAGLIKDEIYQLCRSGATIIFSTHRMEQVEEICDQIILVNQGKKILDGTVAQVKQDFKENLYHLELAGPSPFLHTHPSFEVVQQKAHSLVIRIQPGYSSNDVLHFFINQNQLIVSFNEILPSLNDIFIKLVEGTPLARQFQHPTA
jgi:ABC-2 type transport system ATP-binding protein